MAIKVPPQSFPAGKRLLVDMCNGLFTDVIEIRKRVQTASVKSHVFRSPTVSGHYSGILNRDIP